MNHQRSLIGHPLVLSYFHSNKSLTYRDNELENFAKRSFLFPLHPARGDEFKSCCIVHQPISLFTNLVKRTKIREEISLPTREGKRVLNFHRDDAPQNIPKSVVEKKQRNGATQNPCHSGRKFYFNTLSTVHVVRGGRKRKQCLCDTVHPEAMVNRPSSPSHSSRMKNDGGVLAECS